MAHNRECPKCGTIGEWNWASERKQKTMPNGEVVMARVIVEGEDAVKCPKCGLKFEPRAHAMLRQKMKKVFSNGEVEEDEQED